MKRSIISTLLLFLAGFLQVHSQDNFYDLGTIREIRIHFAVGDWKYVLDSIFQNEGDEGRLVGDVTIDGTTLRNAGVRYKGYSSWNHDEIKNPFNIELDYLIKNQNYKGFTKIKLSNAIHDPSFIREVLAYRIARKYMPASEANYANLYINDTLIGLYTSVESVDSKFMGKHFSNGGNSFFKGEPDTLEYPFGVNANLDDSHGEDSSGYFPFYKAESTYGWNDLYHFIHILNEETDSVETILNTDQALWMHAFNYTLLNLDSYIGYSQNYYLYKDDNGRFNPVIWDLNMSFGSFRESDGSTHFLGLTIPQMKTLDPLEHLNFSITPRPLMTNLFKNDRYRKIYLAHMRTILKENFISGEYYTGGEELQNLIDESVSSDTNKFYPYGDFRKNLDETVGGTGAMIKYPGIKDLMEARITYLNAYEGFTGEPVISAINHVPDLPERGENVQITAKVEGAGNVILAYRYSVHDVFLKTGMEDDGQHNDSASGDKVYGAGISASGPVIQYYIYAENDTAAVFSPERAETEYYTIQPVICKGEVVINEIRAGNNGWIEMFNSTADELDLHDYYLSNDPAITGKWQFPDTIISSKSYMIIPGAMCSAPGSLSSSFTLPGNGGMVFFSGPGGQMIDSVIYGQQSPEKSFGRYPNGYGNFTFMVPSQSICNYIGTTPSSGFSLFPDPARTTIYIELKSNGGPVTARIFNTLGEDARDFSFDFGGATAQVCTEALDISGLGAGLYYVQVDCDGTINTQKFIIY